MAPLAFLTFPLALLGYVGLTVAALWAAYGRLPAVVKAAVALDIAAHVLLVWTSRYDWQLERATRNGYVGFIIFHAALVLIVAAVVLPQRLSAAALMLAFGIVTFGALGAVFRYEEVASYRIPVIVCASAGMIGLLARLWRRPTSEADTSL